jgi:ribosomal protein S20
MDNFDFKKFLAEGKLHEAEMSFDSDIEGKTNKNDFAFWYRAGARGKAQALKAQELLKQKGIDADYSKGPFYIDFSNSNVEQRAVMQLLRDAGLDRFVIMNTVGEGQLNEAMSPQDVVDIADTVAEEFTKESAEDGDFLIYTVGKMEGEGFELDTDVSAQTPDSIDTRGVGEGWGGIFRIKPSADGYEVRNAEKGGLVATIDGSGNFKMLSAAESRAELNNDKIDMDRYNDELNPGMYIDDEEWEREMGRMEESKEEKKSNKMKKSELKEMIKSAFLNETEIKETLSDTAFDMMQDVVDALGAEKAIEELVRAMSDDDALSYLEYIIRVNDINSGKEVDDIPGFEGTKDALDSLSIREEEEEDVEVEDKEEIDIDTDAETADAGEVDVEADAEVEMTGDTKSVQDNLEAALEAAKALGDQKLVDQIGNSITFFTRTHVVGKKDVAEGDIDVEVDSPSADAEVGMNLNESVNRMKKLAGLIK